MPHGSAGRRPAGGRTECGVARFLTLLEGPWATLIVRELLNGPRRFTELRAALPGISPHTLTRRLRQFPVNFSPKVPPVRAIWAPIISPTATAPSLSPAKRWPPGWCHLMSAANRPVAVGMSPEDMAS
ncbi:winged helix-turn-helix transcriptional regulator [Glycomyces luteolus]|uniref:winged helix-turn-helix transcriptional regulator n=1 Tax=Glycomyces luteolus TaxID=2670330 RepID=UPI0038CC1A0A